MFSSDSVYWLFSTSAQVLSAMLGLLLAGYALMFSMMETKVEADDSLQEINAKLQKDYYRQLAALTIVSICAIIFDLVVLSINRTGHPALPVSQALAAVLTVIATVQAAWFIISISNPNKYDRAAETIVREERLQPVNESDAVSTRDYLAAVDRMQELLREYWDVEQKKFQLSTPGHSEPDARRMFRDLQSRRDFSEDLPDTFRKIFLTSSLVKRGKLTEVKSEQMQLVRDAKEKLEKLVEKAKSTDEPVGPLRRHERAKDRTGAKREATDQDTK